MTRNNVLASVLYKLAISLKTMNYRVLNKDKNRRDVISTLSLMQFLVQCIGMKSISDEQTETILSVLANTYDYDASDISDCLREAVPESDLSKEYDDLQIYMYNILSSCVEEISNHKNGYKEEVRKYILGFHNLPRAFLSLADRSKISPIEALDYSKPYLNNH